MRHLGQLSGCGCCGMNRRQVSCDRLRGMRSDGRRPGDQRAGPRRPGGWQDAYPNRFLATCGETTRSRLAQRRVRLPARHGPHHGRAEAAVSGLRVRHLDGKGAAEAKQILEQDKSAAVDGYLVFQMNCWNRVVQTIAASGKPTLYADFQYAGSGGFLVYTSQFLRSGTPNVGFVASSRFEDLVAAVQCFELVKKGGSPAEFAAATARARKSHTPPPAI